MRIVHSALILLAAIALASCTKSLTQEELALLEQMMQERSSVQSDIASAETEFARYSGGLVSALIKARIEVLKTTDALIQQRMHAIQSGAPVSLQTNVTAADPQRAAELLIEIQNQEAELERAKLEAAKYSGGLVHAMALSTVATKAQTIATLRHAQIVAKYGLAHAGPSQPTDQTATTPPQSILATPAAEDADASEALRNEIVSVRILNKKHSEQSYQEFIFFDLEFTAVGLDRPSRAIKGTLNINDLFGERKLGVGWTIDLPMKPGGTVTEKGAGFKYNQFTSSHQWVRSTKLADMAATFTVSSILYEDGTRRDLE